MKRRLSQYIDEIGSGSGIVTKIVVQSRHRDRVSVFVDGEFAFGVGDEVATIHAIRPGCTVTRSLLERVYRDEEVASCKRVAIRYISYRLRSETEVRRRLAKENASDSAVDKVLADLREIGIIDDLAFAEAYARDAAIGRKWGPHRIAKGLRQAGVGSPEVSQALSEVRHVLEDENLVGTLAEKRWNQLSNVDDLMKRKKRVYDYLLRRGFDFDDVRRAVNELAS